VARVAAPVGDFSVEHLGAAYDASFQRIPGPRVFNAAEAPTTLDEWANQFETSEHERRVHANASAWASVFGLSADLDIGSGWQYASYRAVQIHHVAMVDDAQMAHPPPGGAVYYLSAIYFGHIYEEVFRGSAQSFGSGVQAELPFASVGLSTWARTHNVAMQSRGLGLRPRNGEALFARSPDEVRANYVADESDPVPILVDYRVLPGVPPPPESPLAATPQDVAAGPFHAEAVGCSCGAGQIVQVVCRVTNDGAAAGRVRVAASAVTGTLGYHAAGEGETTVPGRGFEPVTINAPIAGAWLNCGSANCSCTVQP
jgi:hypothetical protein